ncbi:hypothetical protein KCU62_g104, partial [Aureobasidium sp. EXF-3399]
MSPGNCVASESRLDIAWSGPTVTEGSAVIPPAASVATLRIDERPNIKVGSTTPVAAFDTCATREAMAGWTDVWMSLGKRVAPDRSSETAWSPSADETPPAALVASASTDERLETRFVIAWRGSRVIAGVESELPAAEVASERITERLETSPESTTPVEAAALIWDTKEDTAVAAAPLTCETKEEISGWIEVCMSAGSCVASLSKEETACTGSRVIAGVDNASPAATVPSERIDESAATRVGSTEPVAAAAVTCETRDDMVGESEVWMSSVTKAVGNIVPSPGRPAAIFKMEEMAFVTWGSIVPVAEASKPEATESREDKAGFTLLCASSGKPDASAKREEIAEIGSAVIGFATRLVTPGIPVASTRMDDSAELALKSPIVAVASICVATDNNEERAGCTLLTTSDGKLETAENNDESAGTGSVVTGFATREASSGMPVTSTRTEDMAEVATGSITLVATFEASPNKDDSAGTAVAWTSAGRFDASKSKEEITETGSKVAVGTGKAEEPSWPQVPELKMTRLIPLRLRKMFDWLGTANKDDNAMLAEVGRAPPSTNEDIAGNAPTGIAVWVGTWIKEFKTETAEVKAPVARLPITDIAEFTPGKIEVSTGTASKVVEGTKETSAVGVEVPGRLPTFVTPPSNSDTAEDAALGKAEF